MCIICKGVFPRRELPTPPPPSPLCALLSSFFFFSPFTWSLISGCPNLLFIKRLNEARMLQNSVLSHRPPLQAVFCNFSRCAELMLLSVCEISSRFLRGATLPSEVPIQHRRGQTGWQQGCDSGCSLWKRTKGRRYKGKKLENQNNEEINRRNGREARVRE